MSAISIRGLSKQFGEVRALRDLSLEVPEGEVIGFLGLNGAGKTTTVRILLDLLRPTSGSASILGHDCQSDSLRARASAGFLPGELGAYTNLTGSEVLRLLTGLSPVQPNLAFRSQLQERLGLPDSDLRRRLREYSTGMKRKLGIIQAFQNDPPVLILDEPTEGLDPLMQESFHGLLAEARARGRTIFMSSHVLSEVERVCDRIALLRGGELVVLAPVDEIRRMAPRHVRVLFSADVPAAPPGLGGSFEWIETTPRLWSLRVTGELGPLLSFLRSLPASDLTVQEPRLEDVLLRYYRKGTN